MRWTIEFGGDPQDVTVTTSGEATPEAFARMNADLVEDERFRAGMLVLVDHTDLIVNELPAQDVRWISIDFDRHGAEFGSAAIAIVAPEPVQFGLARMSAAFAESAPNIHVFYSRPEALEWLQNVLETGSTATP